MKTAFKAAANVTSLTNVKGRNVKVKMNKWFLGLLLFAAQIYGDCRIYTDNNDLLGNGRSTLSRGTFVSRG